MSLKVYISPNFRGEDKGDGGVRRVVDAQREHLGKYDIEVVEEPRYADVLAIHIMQEGKVLERFPEIPLVAHSHGLYWAEYDWRVKKGDQEAVPAWIKSANSGCMELIRQADFITAPSEWVAQVIRRNTLRWVIPIGHGINLDEWPEPENYDDTPGPVLWNKTRVDAVCDPREVNQLADLVPDVPFLSTYGDGKLPNMILTGTLPYENAKALIQDAGVYLCTARETFGIGTLEAMACGVPILGWAYGGQMDIVEHKKTGWLAPPGDYENLVEGLRYCLNHKARMGREARAAVEKRYQWEPIIGVYAALYKAAFEYAQKERPKVSVIVTAYDLEKYLPEALESVIGQSMGDWECVIVDDHSPDSCGQIAERFVKRDSRFSVIHNEENQYLAGALNTGIAAAKGKYILPLDADNFLPHRTLEWLANHLDDNRNIHIAYGNVEFLDPPSADHPEGRRWHSGWPPEFKGEWQVQRPENQDRPNNLIPSTSLFRREVWELTGGYRQRYRTAEDADFWTRATSYGFRAVRAVEADTLVYRNRDESMSRTEELPDWTLWFPWSRDLSAPPAAVIAEIQAPIPMYLPAAVSIIIPVGPGHEELLIDALDSVDAQAFRRWECIVVNDTGRPLRWVPSWAKIITTSGKIGVAAARNLGVAASTAKLFLPLDADDTITMDCLVHMVRTQKEFGGYVYCDWYKRETGKPTEVWEVSDWNAQFLIDRGSLHAVTALYPKAAWEAIGGFDEELSAWEDWDFQLKLANTGWCGTRIPQPLFTYRVDKGTRREDNFGGGPGSSGFEISKQGILRKWKPFFDGKEELMGCRSCPNGGGGQLQPPPTFSSTAPVMAANELEKYEIFEYIGSKAGTMNFRGRETGTMYRFSNRPSERRKYVLKADAEFFEQRPDFNKVDKRAPVA
jgi:glycosyltransferase involved in cell wall biosynthesis